MKVTVHVSRDEKTTLCGREKSRVVVADGQVSMRSEDLCRGCRAAAKALGFGSRSSEVSAIEGVAVLTHEELEALWTAIGQFIDNSDECEHEYEPGSSEARELAAARAAHDKIEAFLIPLLETNRRGAAVLVTKA